MISAERLAQIEAEANAATGGRWSIASDNMLGSQSYVIEASTGPDICRPYRRPDATFIANARQNIPDLIAEVRRLQAENERLVERIRRGIV